MPHVKPPSGGDIAQLTGMLNRVAFSATSAPQIPVVRAFGTQRVYDVDDFRMGARDTLRFMLKVMQIPDDFSVPTRWGSGRIGITDYDEYVAIGVCVDAPNRKVGLDLSTSFKDTEEGSVMGLTRILNPGEAWHLDAELSFLTGEFGVRQFALIDDQGRGMIATAIAFGAQLLTRSAEMRMSFPYGAGDVWDLLGAQVEAEGVTPMTALLAANLVPGEKVIPSSIAIGSFDGDYLIRTVERAKTVYVPLGPQIGSKVGEPVATVSFIPDGGISHVLDRKVSSPFIEVCQTIPLPLKVSGPQLYAPILAGGLIAAAQMNPLFPLASLVRP
jgi:hypothetical protein